MKKLILFIILIILSGGCWASTSDSTYLSHLMVLKGKEVAIESRFIVTVKKITWITSSLLPGGTEKKVEYIVTKINISKSPEGLGDVVTYLATEASTNDSCRIVIDFLNKTIDLIQIGKNNNDFKITFPIS